MNGEPCGACGSYLDPHSCPPLWRVWVQGREAAAVEVHASSGSEAGSVAAERLNLPAGEHRLCATDNRGRAWSGRCRSSLRMSHIVILLPEEEPVRTAKTDHLEVTRG